MSRAACSHIQTGHPYALLSRVEHMFLLRKICPNVTAARQSDRAAGTKHSDLLIPWHAMESGDQTQRESNDSLCVEIVILKSNAERNSALNLMGYRRGHRGLLVSR
jgi:hypothetical protein